MNNKESGSKMDRLCRVGQYVLCVLCAHSLQIKISAEIERMKEAKRTENKKKNKNIDSISPTSFFFPYPTRSNVPKKKCVLHEWNVPDKTDEKEYKCLNIFCYIFQDKKKTFN